jgi:hypothetical protein
MKIGADIVEATPTIPLRATLSTGERDAVSRVAALHVTPCAEY